MTLIELVVAATDPLEADEALFVRLLTRVTSTRRDYIMRYRQPSDRCRSLAATLALDHLLAAHGVTLRDCAIERGANGKPFLKDRPDLHFNMSHSGRYGVAALAAVPVGVDVERTARFRLEVAKYFLRQDEIDRLLTLAEGRQRDRRFTELWTRWEARHKLTGKGLAAARRDYAATGGNEPPLFFSERWLDDEHHLTLACDVDPDDCRVETEKLHFE